MVSEGFRAGETSARLAWTGRMTGPRRCGPAAATGPAGPVGPMNSLVRVAAGQPRLSASGGHDPARRTIQGRSILGPAGVLRYPSTSLLCATRLHTCYTVLNRGRSAESARSLLTELFRLYTAAGT